MASTPALLSKLSTKAEKSSGVDIAINSSFFKTTPAVFALFFFKTSDIHTKFPLCIQILPYFHIHLHRNLPFVYY
jgi:hypothetical protein